ncbi:hypothetical protein M0811_06157 [Anaeramoeba ignava]|uniref:Uncharacterized protein n=1 Tax=Anaeramoeba ignava TaxID=1746090 RepID=A0A9Q0LPA7_ANAIG|nr:hypothetical protein M0811_06157 [Anaeramoeba ignava]
MEERKNIMIYDLNEDLPEKNIFQKEFDEVSFNLSSNRFNCYLFCNDYYYSFEKLKIFGFLEIEEYSPNTKNFNWN